MSPSLAPLALCALLLAVPAADDAEIIAAQLPTYPLDTCLMSDLPLGDEPVEVVSKERLVRFCCGDCAKEFRKHSKEALAKLDAAVIAAQSAHYPLDTCVVDDEPLHGEDAEPVDEVVGTRLVRVCDSSCARKLASRPEKYLPALDAAYVAAQLPAYPLDECALCDAGLEEGTAVNVLHGNRLVRLCWEGCAEDFRANPAPGLAKLDAAAGR